MAEANLKEIMPLFNPVYSPQYLELSNHLLSAIRNKQFSPEANQIAEDILRNDPSDYNAWYLKKMYLMNHINQPNIIQQEIDFADQILDIKAKGFQIWEQRRFLSQRGANIEKEYQNIEKVLGDKDHKNYHTWSFRVWLANKIQQYTRELKYTQKMIKRDAFNNSAWSHRFFSLQSLLNKLGNQEEKKSLLDQQVKFALQSLKKYKYNRATWNYLRGFFPSIQLKKFSSKNTLKSTLLNSYDEYPEIQSLCIDWWNQAKEAEKNESKEISQMIERQVLATLVHIYSQKQQTRQFAYNSCQELILKDLQRRNYWGWVRENL